MARLPALIDAFVSVDGRDRATIEHVARVIRERGFIPTTKRGAGAAGMTSREAVNLLFALNGASSSKDCVEAVERLRRMSSVNAVFKADPIFDSFRGVAGLGGALEHLIDNYPVIQKYFGHSFQNINDYFFDDFSIEIEIHFFRAHIVVKSGEFPGYNYNLRTKFRLEGEDADSYEIFDRRVVTYLSARTIHALWRCVYDGRVAEHD